ncbi:biopolymer transporter ExbD [Endozoicomonas gorgoniicola]|uniref:Biopolymer transporter ExbD n=1 Tax=Endozoicomonas gorgoniicola TaxID=1234144 RepID=A0ABT3N3S4_9GAMM|nr:biopolymer transporter ExbD [Endozoicomonas gorgoniicola]MCW7556278.1 biopolymer transporter ExbD [Endozoicomonas gorgoniicola]
MQFQHSRETESEASVDLTPLIDVVFILLIFFILSASFQQTQNLNIERPTASTVDSLDKTALMVSIDQHNVVWFEGNAIKPAQLAREVKYIAAGTSQISAIVDVDQNVNSGRLIEVVDQLRISGVKNVAVATQTPH